MCKLWAIQGEFTQSEAAAKLKDRIRVIRRTEGDGLGISLYANKKLVTWQCGESIYDSIGENVLSILNETPTMCTMAVHGRTSTSNIKDVNHSHPRKTDLGALMHNGVVFPKYTNPFTDADGNLEEWKESYDLDTDYLVELANRGLLDKAEEYLDGYAAVIIVQNDGTLIVQNQGASLLMTLKSGEVEFGTTHELCPMGNRFEKMRAECYEGTIYSRPINNIERKDYKSKFEHLTGKSDKEDFQKKQTSISKDLKNQQVHTSTGQNLTTMSIPEFIESDEKKIKQKKKNKKGRRGSFLYQKKEFYKTDSAPSTDKKPTMITVYGQRMSLEDFLKNRKLREGDQAEILRAMRA